MSRARRCRPGSPPAPPGAIEGTLRTCSAPAGERPMTSVKVPPRSIQNCQPGAAGARADWLNVSIACIIRACERSSQRWRCDDARSRWWPDTWSSPTARKAAPGDARSPRWRRWRARKDMMRTRSITAASMSRVRAIAKLVDFCKELAGDLVLVGSSLGGYIAVASASLLHARGVFLMAPALYMEGLPELRAGVLDCPASVVHGWRDDVVPYEHSVRFANTYRPPCTCSRAIIGCTTSCASSSTCSSTSSSPSICRRSPSSDLQRRSRIARAAMRSTRRGATSRAQRAMRPRAEVTSRRWRRCMAPHDQPCARLQPS